MNFDLLKAKILPYLKTRLTKEKLGHVMGVAFLAEKIAKKHKIDPERAKLSGLLHDAARQWPPLRLVRYARRYRIKVPDPKMAFKRPVLLHSFVGAHLARSLFGIRDRGILSAVEKHTLGSVRMAALDKCLYVADFAAPDRKFPKAARLRQLALKNLDRAFYECMKLKLEYSLKKNEIIHPESLRAWDRLAGRK